MPGFQSFFSVFASFCIGRISHQQQKGKYVLEITFTFVLSCIRVICISIRVHPYSSCPANPLPKIYVVTQYWEYLVYVFPIHFRFIS